MRFAFVIPGCAVPWERTGHNRKTGAFFTRKRTVKYQEKVRRCARIAGVQVLAAPVRLVLHIVWPDRRTRDDDNVEKTIRDALQAKPARKKKRGGKTRPRPAIAFFNDSAVRSVAKEVSINPAAPRVEVELEGEPAFTNVKLMLGGKALASPAFISFRKGRR